MFQMMTPSNGRRPQFFTKWKTTPIRGRLRGKLECGSAQPSSFLLFLFRSPCKNLKPYDKPFCGFEQRWQRTHSTRTNSFCFVLNSSCSAEIVVKCGSPGEESEMLDLFKFLISGVLTLLTGLVGTLGNILSIATLLHRYNKLLMLSQNIRIQKMQAIHFICVQLFVNGTVIHTRQKGGFIISGNYENFPPFKKTLKITSNGRGVPQFLFYNPFWEKSNPMRKKKEETMLLIVASMFRLQRPRAVQVTRSDQHSVVGI